MSSIPFWKQFSILDTNNVANGNFKGSTGTEGSVSWTCSSDRVACTIVRCHSPDDTFSFPQNLEGRDWDEEPSARRQNASQRDTENSY